MYVYYRVTVCKITSPVYTWKISSRVNIFNKRYDCRGRLIVISLMWSQGDKNWPTKCRVHWECGWIFECCAQ